MAFSSRVVVGGIYGGLGLDRPAAGGGGGRLGGALAGGALLDALLGVRHVDHALDVDAGRVDAVGIEFARLDQVLDLGHRDRGGGGHHGVEVARGLAIDQVAL